MKNTDAGNIEAPNSVEFDPQMDVDAGQDSRNCAVLLGVLRIFLEGRSGPANGTVIAPPASDSETTESHVSRDAKTIRDTKSRAAKQIISRCTKVLC